MNHTNLQQSSKQNNKFAAASKPVSNKHANSVKTILQNKHTTQSDAMYGKESAQIAGQMSAIKDKPETLRKKLSMSRLLQQNDFSTEQRKSNKDLPENVNSKMESIFGEDFSNVKIHKESMQANSWNVLAFTQDENIHFATGQFNPQSESGQKLIGHEFAHISQQRHRRVVPTSKFGSISLNDDKSLENEADILGSKVAQARVQDNIYSESKFSASNLKKRGVAQFALPPIVAAMGAAEWLAAGGLGYLVVNDAVKSGSGDVSYSFDEVEGVLLPGGGSDVTAHKRAHPGAEIFEATHYFAIWGGTSGNRKMGMKFGITFLYDNAGAIGNISLSIINVYDWPGWGGNINVNITPRSLAAGNASFRFTINVGEDNSWFVSERPGSVQLRLRGGDGDLSLTVNNYFGYTEIG